MVGISTKLLICQEKKITPNFHIIKAHLKFYFNETGKSLGFYTDQLVESMYKSKLMLRLVALDYYAPVGKQKVYQFQLLC